MVLGKSFISITAAAAIMSSSAVALAAANPFEDVPADHWAYDAVAQLAKDGVVEGYGDGTYIGEAAITRYEMAQMIARAMTKSDIQHTDKALLQKLSAEFSDELSKLGVRISTLEKKVDNVRFRGSIRYIWRNERHGEGHPQNSQHGNTNDLRLILWNDIGINKNWTGHSRIQYVTNMDTARNCASSNPDDMALDRLYVTGRYNNVIIRLGKFDYESKVDDGMMFGGDNSVSGGQVVLGRDVKVSLMAGRHTPPISAAPYTINYQAIEVYSDKNKLTWGLGYNFVSSNDAAWYANGGASSGRIGIWDVGLGWKFDRKWHLVTSYSRAQGVDNNARIRGQLLQDADKYAYSIALNYGRMNPGKVGDIYGFIAYRHLSHLGVVAQRVHKNNAFSPNQKGFHLGIGWTFAPRMVATFEYFVGKDIAKYTNQSDARTFFGRLEAFF